MLSVRQIPQWFSKDAGPMVCIEEEALVTGPSSDSCGTSTRWNGGPHHTPAMVNEVVELLVQTKARFVVDGTAGEGGHSAAMSEHLQEDGVLLALDRDPSVMSSLRGRLANVESAMVMKGLYQDLPILTEELGLPSPDFVLLDLGLSSFQLADSERGFSFQRDDPCDMRMSCEGGMSAAEVINEMDYSQLADLLYELGGERRARRIALEILKERERSPIRTNRQLLSAIQRAYQGKRGRLHPATRTFQALRIYVNAEMEAIQKALQVIPPILTEGGILAVISYHSLEDSKVKGAFRELEDDDYEVLTNKPVRPSTEEISSNRRSRSAKLRALRRRVI